MTLGVCSWSLRPRDAVDLAEKLRRVGLRHVQLALDPIRERRWDLEATLGELAAAGVVVLSGMMSCKGEDYSTLESIRATGGLRPDATWEANLKAARRNAEIGEAFSLRLVTLHAGFLPEEASDPLRETMIDRLATIAGVYYERGIEVALETGQEKASTLMSYLEDDRLAAVGVNFDPANMVLYGMGDPVESLRTLADRVSQVHLKDALAPEKPGEWGREVAAGEGAVDLDAFFDVLKDKCPDADVIIEREAGEDRAHDIVHAREVAVRHGIDA